jgi:hypothetical protein
MVITTTSASAMAAGAVLTDVASEDRENALFLLTALADCVHDRRRSAQSSRQAYARATDWLAQPDQDNETP